MGTDRGPGSSVYGSSAIFGVYNVLLRRGKDIQGIEASGEVGSFNSYKGRITAGYGFTNGLELLLSGSYYDSRGPESLYFPEFDSPQFNNGVARDLDYERHSQLFGKLSWNDLTLTTAWNSREKGIPTAAYDAYFGDPREQAIDSAWFADLKFDRELDNGLHLTSRLAYHDYAFQGWFPYAAAAPGDPPSVVVNRDDVDGEWWGLETTVSREFFDQFTLTGGVEFRDNFRQDQENFDEGSPRVQFVDVESRSHVIGLYGQGDWAIATNLMASVGLRYDYYSTFGGTWNPRVGVMFRPWDSTAWKLLYGRAFRAPNAYESAYEAPFFRSNPDLQPETINITYSF